MIIDLHSDTIQRAKDEKLKLTSKKLSVNIEETMQNFTVHTSFTEHL